MARPRQKKKQRSSRQTVRTGTAGRTKTGKKKVNFLGNEIIAKHWDHKLTLAQNYDRLGLSVRLNSRTGGVEKNVNGKDGVTHVGGSLTDSLRISRGGGIGGKLVPSEVEVERDPETGAILRIIGDDDDGDDSINSRLNPLNDPLNAFDEDDDDDDKTVNAKKTTNEIVKQLEAQAVAEMEDIIAKKKPRSQSTREEEWIRSLVEEHGDDYTAMFRDRKLNPRQQSEGDIKRRVKKWKAKHG